MAIVTPTQKFIDDLKGVSPFVSTNVNQNNKLSINNEPGTRSIIIGSTTVVDFINLTLNNGETVSLKATYKGISVEESIFNAAIRGTLMMYDDSGGLEKFTIEGGEKISIKISGPKTKEGNAGPILIWREDLVVQSITKNEVSIRNTALQYSLIFTSKSYLTSIKRNYFYPCRESIATAVVSIFKQMSTNDLFIEDPKITLKTPYLPPGINPHKVIDQLAQRACASGKYFVFFERFVPITGTYPDGRPFAATHVFMSLDTIYSQARGVPKIIFAQKLNANLESNNYLRAGRYVRENNFNHINAMMLGLYNSELVSINPIRKVSNTEILSYTRNDTRTSDFYVNKLLSSKNFFSYYNDLENENPGRKLFFKSVNDPVAKESWLSKHIFGNLTKNLFKVTVDIQGGTNTIGIGQVVDFYAPSQVSLISNPQSSTPEIDRLYSGFYLVTSVVHQIVEGKYIKTLELSRGSSPINLDSELRYVELSKQEQDQNDKINNNIRLPSSEITLIAERKTSTKSKSR